MNCDKQAMKYLIPVLTDYTYPYLERVLTDVKLSGIELIPVKAAAGTCAEELIPLDEDMMRHALEGSNSEYAYILTDCSAGVRLAKRYAAGYVFCDITRDGEISVLSDAIRTDAGTEQNGLGCRIEDTEGPQCIIQGFDEIDADFLIKMYQRYHHIPWTILKTKRLTLREMTVDDVDRLYEIYDGEGMTDYTEPLYEDKSLEVEYTRDYIRNMYEFCGYGLWLVIENDSGRVVGRAGITGREGYEQAELGYVIERSRQRRGYAAEACTAIIDYARDVLGMSALNCFVHPGNEASVRLCRRLGFKYLEDTELSGIGMIRYYLLLQ